MSEESAINQAAQELGALLKAKRTEKNIAIGEVAERLKFSAKQIESLESGDYKGLPEPIFVKGFIKTYGRFLGLDTDQVTSLLNEVFPSQVSAAPAAAVADSQSSLNFQDQKKSKAFPKWLPLVVVAAVVVGAVYLWQSKSTEQNRQQEKSTLEVGDVAQLQLATDNVQVVPMKASATNAASAAVGASAPAAASAAVADGSIQIKVRYRSNLIVTDADGTPLHSGIVASNSTHQFKGKAPYQVRIGYATGSEISFNGQAIDIKNHFVYGKTVALTVPQQ